MRIMKVLHLIPSLELGGAQRQLSLLAPALAARGHEVHIASVQSGEFYSELQSSSLKLHRLRARGNYDPAIAWQIVKLIRSVRPDIVQTWILQMDILGGLACGLTKTPWILREPTNALGWPNTPKNWLRRRVGATASAIVSNSRGGDEYWSTHHPASRRFTIRNGLPLQEIEAASASTLEELGLESSQSMILYAGRFIPDKNIESLIAALEQVIRCADVVALLCGEGSRRAQAESLIKERGLEKRILITGYVSNIWSLMKAARVMVSISRREGQPNAVIEAMACGAPLVVSDIPAHGEFLDENSALLVDYNRPDEVAAAILQVLESPREALERARCAAQIAAQWSVEALAQRYEEMYLRVLAQSRAVKQGVE